MPMPCSIWQNLRTTYACPLKRLSAQSLLRPWLLVQSNTKTQVQLWAKLLFSDYSLSKGRTLEFLLSLLTQYTETTDVSELCINVWDMNMGHKRTSDVTEVLLQMLLLLPKAPGLHQGPSPLGQSTLSSSHCLPVPTRGACCKYHQVDIGHVVHPPAVSTDPLPTVVDLWHMDLFFKIFLPCHGWLAMNSYPKLVQSNSPEFF